MNELLRNCATRGVVRAFFAVVWVAISLSAAAIDSAQVTNLIQDRERLLSTGYATLLVGNSSAPISALTCGSLSRNSATTGWGMVNLPTDEELPLDGFLRRTESNTALIRSYFGVQESLIVAPRSEGLLLGSPSSYLLDGSPTLTQKVETKSLGPVLNGSVIIGSLRSEYDLCVLRVRIGEREDVQRLARLTFPPADGFVADWALPGADAVANPQNAIDDRLTQFGWIPSGIAGAVTAVVYVLLRRRDMAVYLLWGEAPSVVALRIFGEILLLCLPMLLLACCLASVDRLQNLDPEAQAIHAGLVTLGAAAVVLLASRPKPVTEL